MKPALLHGHRYPWDKWLNGEKITLIRGVQFDCEPASMGILVRLTAKERGVPVSVSVKGGNVEIYPKGNTSA